MWVYCMYERKANKVKKEWHQATKPKKKNLKKKKLKVKKASLARDEIFVQLGWVGESFPKMWKSKNYCTLYIEAFEQRPNL